MAAMVVDLAAPRVGLVAASAAEVEDSVVVVHLEAGKR